MFNYVSHISEFSYLIYLIFSSIHYKFTIQGFHHVPLSQLLPSFDQQIGFSNIRWLLFFIPNLSIKFFIYIPLPSYSFTTTITLHTIKSLTNCNFVIISDSQYCLMALNSSLFFQQCLHHYFVISSQSYRYFRQWNGGLNVALCANSIPLSIKISIFRHFIIY